MYRNNKGSTALIVSLVIGLIVLGVGGYFGYKWYQNKLLDERIAKIEKTEKSINELSDKAESITNENFNPNKISTYKSTLDDVEKMTKELDKSELDSEIKDSVKSCVEKSLQGVELLRRGIDIYERGKKITSQAEANSILNELSVYERDFKNLPKGTCRESAKKAKELAQKLKENK